MKLIPAGGSPGMRKAISHQYVHTIAHILLQDRQLLELVADLLKTFERRGQKGFEETLEQLQINQKRQRFAEVAEDNALSPHILELTQTLQKMYQQPDEDIRYQRGAIVELLAYELVRHRYRPGECLGNQRFIDEHGKAITDQIDVAALSQTKQQIEGYECKLKVDGVESSDCTNLAYLADAAQERDYDANVGIISFNDSRYMRRRLARLQPDASILLYGLDNLHALETFSF